MDQEQINKIEEIIEKHLFEETNNSAYELNKIYTITQYLIYQQLKEINKKLDSIDENLYELANPGIWEK